MSVVRAHSIVIIMQKYPFKTQKNGGMTPGTSDPLQRNGNH